MRLALLLMLLALGCAQSGAPEGPLPPGDHLRRLAHGGRERSYVLHVPPARASAPRPLLLAFHGGGGNGPGFQRYAGLDPLADRDGWLVAYPNGTSRRFDERLLTWNAGGCCGYALDSGVDDVGFALAVIDDVARLRAARSRARLRHRALERRDDGLPARGGSPGRLAAIAPVAGAMTLDAFAPAPPRARAAHPQRGRPARALRRRRSPRPSAARSGIVRVEAQLERWREADGCPREAGELEPRSRPAGDGSVHTATLLAWAPCAGGSEVRLWKLTGGGHGWPGAIRCCRSA